VKYVRFVSSGIVGLTIVAAAAGVVRAEQRAPEPALGDVNLTATDHAPVPTDPRQLWFAPETASHTTKPGGLAAGARLYADGRYAEALPLVRAAATSGPLADYARYYEGLAALKLSRLDDADRAFAALMARPLTGYLVEAARLGAADVDQARGDTQGAIAIYAELADTKTLGAEDVLMRLARAAQTAGDLERAARAWARVYYEYPLSDQAAIAKGQLDDLALWQPFERGGRRVALEIGRGERLFGARRYLEARAAFDAVRPYVDGDSAEVAALRVAECDFYLARYAAARDALERWTRTATRRAEAQFFFLSAIRGTGAQSEYVRLARELVNAWPQESWAEETLNNLATHYILADEDDRAEAVFREILERYPESRHAQRAAWRAGWWAYRRGEFAETVRVFEQAAARFPRSDYRPSWLYWSGRAHDQLGHTRTANARYAIVLADYQNSYYGREATRQLDDRRADAVALTTAAVPVRSTEPLETALPPTHNLIRALIAAGLYDDALKELQYAQRVWGDSAAIQATMGLVYSRSGDLRRGINAVKRAYPQYIASGGEELPVEMLRVLFPVQYWDAIKRHAAKHDLDPYLIAALMAQESTFDPGIRSRANAIGLMQIVPSTGSRYARRLGIRRFRSSMLTNPEINIRIGTAIFADLVQRTGGTHLALASYNAGEGAVARWVSERGRIAADEFIDDIPYPETQNYVKRIVGTAEDYRRLYGELGAKPLRPDVVKAKGTSGTSTVKAPAKTKKRVSTAKKRPAPVKSRRRK